VQAPHKNLLIITQKVDEDDDLLGSFVGWIGEFAKHFEHVHVITLGAGTPILPSNVFVHSLGKEHGAGKIIQTMRLVRYLWKYGRNCTAYFSHMSPIFAIIAWPFARLRGAKNVLWYLHRSVTARLRLALFLSDTLVTASKASLRIQSPKIIEVGHGIDIQKFATQREWTSATRIISVGRISPIKNFETLLYAVQTLHAARYTLHVTIVGRPVMPGDHAYFEKIKKIGGAEFVGFVPYSEIANYYRDADIAVNLAPTGGIDKVVLEAMASGCVVLVSNEAFRPYLGSYADELIIDRNDPQAVADAILNIQNKTTEELKAISRILVDCVRSEHALGATIKEIALIIVSQEQHLI